MLPCLWNCLQFCNSKVKLTLIPKKKNLTPSPASTVSCHPRSLSHPSPEGLFCIKILVLLLQCLAKIQHLEARQLNRTISQFSS